MKKFTSILSALVLTSGMATIQAQDMYISASFNNFNPDGQEEWKLFQGVDDSANDGEDESYLYSGYFEVEAGELSFNFVYDDKYLVPADGANETVTLTDKSYITKCVEGASGIYWEFTALNDGELGVTVNVNTYTVTIEFKEQVDDVWFLRGPFNNYNPGKLAKWALMPIEEDENGESQNGVYGGTFEISAGEFAINFLSPYDTVFIPQDIANESITFTDGIYKGKSDYAYDATEAIYCWTYEAWEGGKVFVSIDSNTGNVVIKDLSESSAIKNIEKVLECTETIYNLQGVKVDGNKLNKGIYLINGKKVLVK